MDKYKETFETWNKIANLYEEKFMYLSLYNETYDFFSKTLTKEQLNILEIGCGPGNITKYLLSKRSDLKITGIDIAPNMIELAKANNPSANFKLMDTRELDSLSQKFDAIVCGFCLPYLSQQDSHKLMNDAGNILLTNGILYLSFVQGKPYDSGFISGSTGDRVFFYYHSLEGISSQLLINNFIIIKLFDVSYFRGKNIETHTIIIAKKTI
ncbi:class I SAM-dependent DNA methyltransferase [Flavobacterium panacagri]|uniref:class I SAM-dependent DNA methyltransferase n=1 Tax=Flavobacterium panacagri TaxID=3034146 RepID=UPI0025A54FE2|nr:class I SAM-dependent methyltransferase [Flavobacterium panacagri]